MPEKRKQNDDWNWDSQQPEKNSSTHDRSSYPLYVGVGELGRFRYLRAAIPCCRASGENPASTIVGARRGSASIEISGGPIIPSVNSKTPSLVPRNRWKCKQGRCTRPMSQPTGATRAVRLIGPSVGPLTPQFQDRLSERHMSHQRSRHQAADFRRCQRRC